MVSFILIQVVLIRSLIQVVLLCCVVFLVLVLCLAFLMMQVSLSCPFLIGPLVSINVYCVYFRDSSRFCFVSLQVAEANKTSKPIQDDLIEGLVPRQDKRIIGHICMVRLSICPQFLRFIFRLKFGTLFHFYLCPIV